MKKTVLHIDMSVSKAVLVELSSDNTVLAKREAHDTANVQPLLILIESVLSENGLTLSDLTEITTMRGPGSYTGLRVGLAVANTLGTLLGIPVNGLPVGKAGEKDS